MKKYKNLILYSIAVVLIFILAIFGYRYLTQEYSPNEIEIGKDNQNEESQSKAPDFTVINNNGDEVKLSDYIGKLVVVNFWATWCGPCASELPAFDNAYEKYKDEVEFLMVNLTDGYSETVDKVKKYVKDNGYTFPVYYDTKYSATNAYSIYSIPRTLFIDKKGNLIYSSIGAMSEEILNKYIENLKEGQMEETL